VIKKHPFLIEAKKFIFPSNLISKISINNLAGDKPLIAEMRDFRKLDGKKVDVVSEMSSEFRHVGQCLLLNDKSKVASLIDKHHGSAVDISQGIVQEWVRGQGRHPVEWRTLLECLREVSLYHLEEEIIEEMEDRPSE